MTERRDSSQVESTKSINVDLKKFMYKNDSKPFLASGQRHMTPTNKSLPPNTDAMLDEYTSNIKQMQNKFEGKLEMKRQIMRQRHTNNTSEIIWQFIYY